MSRPRLAMLIVGLALILIALVGVTAAGESTLTWTVMQVVGVVVMCGVGYPSSWDRGSTEMTLTEFLLARVAEDESNDTTLIGVARKDWAARWATECEAKRLLIQRVGNPDWAGFRILALPYADHADYDERWRP